MQVLLLNNERFMVPEALFTPADIGLPQAGLPEVVTQSVSALHPALTPLLYGHVVLTGGCAACPGFGPRFERELRPLVPDGVESGVVAPQVCDGCRGWARKCVCVGRACRGRVGARGVGAGVWRVLRGGAAARCCQA